MENYDKNMLERQTDINKAFGRMYFAIYSVDVESGKYLEVSTLDIFRENIPPTGDNKLLFDMVVKHYVSDGYKDSMRGFLNMETLQERLKEQNAVSNEFFGTTQGWCRAGFVVEKRGDDGKVLRFVYVTREINEEVKSERERIAELKRAYEAADFANHAKTDFLFRMSHDIRTPLNAIMGFGSLIKNNPKNYDKVKEYSDKILVSGNLLLSLLNEILDMTKIESGKTVLNEKPLSLKELTDELIMVIRTQAEKKSQTFTVTRNIEHDCYIGDRVCISRILFNILGNAVKYTDTRGKISFDIREIQNGEKSLLVFSVKDNGIGITPQVKERIFDEFLRGNDEVVRKIPGTGLGLPIAKNFTEMMGGSITVESEKGNGSEFVVKIPLPICDKLPKTEKADIAENVFEGLNVLVVEDNELNREIVREILTGLGAFADTAENGYIALDKVKNTAYDVILMDVQMPGMNGYETTENIRASDDKKVSEIPIIALTANAFEEDIKNAEKAGMNGYVSKPIDVDDMKKTVSSVLKGRK